MRDRAPQREGSWRPGPRQEGPFRHHPVLGREAPHDGRGRECVRLSRARHRSGGCRRHRWSRLCGRAGVAVPGAALQRLDLLVRGGDGRGLRNDGRRRAAHRDRRALSRLDHLLRALSRRHLCALVCGRKDAFDPQHRHLAPRDLLLGHGHGDLRARHGRRRHDGRDPASRLSRFRGPLRRPHRAW